MSTGETSSVRPTAPPQTGLPVEGAKPPKPPFTASLNPSGTYQSEHAASGRFQSALQDTPHALAGHARPLKVASQPQVVRSAHERALSTMTFYNSGVILQIRQSLLQNQPEQASALINGVMSETSVLIPNERGILVGTRIDNIETARIILAGKTGRIIHAREGERPVELQSVIDKMAPEERAKYDAVPKALEEKFLKAATAFTEQFKTILVPVLIIIFEHLEKERIQQQEQQKAATRTPQASTQKPVDRPELEDVVRPEDMPPAAIERGAKKTMTAGVQSANSAVRKEKDKQKLAKVISDDRARVDREVRRTGVTQEEIERAEARKPTQKPGKGPKGKGGVA